MYEIRGKHDLRNKLAQEYLNQEMPDKPWGEDVEEVRAAFKAGWAARERLEREPMPDGVIDYANA